MDFPLSQPVPYRQDEKPYPFAWQPLSQEYPLNLLKILSSLKS